MAVVDTGDNSPRVKSDLERIAVGALGGLAAVMAKYISQDHASVVQFFSTNLPASAILSIIGGYFILTPILVILGAIIGWIAAETNRVKLFALGISAPALITTLSSGSSTKLVDAIDILGPNTAIAQGTIAEGLSSFFGSVDRTYVVYVGSFSNKENSDRITNSINNNVRSLHVIQKEFVDSQNRRWYRVYVVQRFSIKEALDVRERLLKSKVVSEAKIVQGFDEAP
jgi:hypothetical protein